MIDVKDLQVGSYVQDPNGKLVTIRELGKVVIVYEARSEKFATMEVLTSIEDLRPIPITTEWLERLGYRLWSGNNERAKTYTLDVAEPTLSLVHWQGEGLTPPTCPLTKIYEYDEDSQSGIGNFIATAKSVHHLQALIWNLERVWLTLPETP